MKVVVAVAVGLVAFPVSAKPPPGPIDPQIHKWFESQVVPDGTGRSCCAYADGHVLDEDSWRINDGNYEVKIGNAWIVFPNTGAGQPHNTVLGATGNPTGHPVAWYIESGGTVYPLCLAPGTVA